ncbi:hypothetical protein B5808_19785 (plasmid) [Cnuibacter physcomitrellae]|uniref:M23ase beta-sheet core domain-containing protein n=2 Tax=Cnuibacter physcomitrellae TaxID=1619308 RepID=A0A1X9LT82_9MICO|nr:hypothetical protein B5808_19785 [Cnuibacter physcomitrellae]
MSRSASRARPHAAILSSLALTMGLILAPSSAQAADYPTWAEVEAARNNEAAQRQQIAELTAMISTLEADLATAQNAATQATQAWDQAQGDLDAATVRTQALTAEAATASAEADQARTTVGQLAATMTRTGGIDQLTAQLLLSGDNATDLLSRLTSTSQLTQTVSVLYAEADAAGNTATALASQAATAEEERARLAVEAEAAMQDAVAASQQVQANLLEQQAAAETMKAQLTVLTENRQATEADYAKGEEVRRAAAAAEAAARAAASGAPQLDSGQLSDQGWGRPVGGRISDGFGPRIAPTAGASTYHNGVDLGASCGTPVYAASAGTVNYAGWFGGFGNWVQITHGSGVQTSYAHNSQLLVSPGETVAAGQVISLAGTTGVSTGCHLHYEITVNGTRIDPEPFMSARGATLG